MPHVPSRLMGFSLLEVLVAVAITALMLGLLYEIFGRSATAARLRSEYATAVVQAESLLASYPTNAGSEARVRPDNAGLPFRVQLKVAPYPATSPSGIAPSLNLVQVTADVVWDSGGRERRIQLTTLKPARSF